MHMGGGGSRPISQSLIGLQLLPPFPHCRPLVLCLKTLDYSKRSLNECNLYTTQSQSLDNNDFYTFRLGGL